MAVSARGVGNDASAAWCHCRHVGWGHSINGLGMHRIIGAMIVVALLAGCGEAGVAVPDVVGQTSDDAVSALGVSELESELIELGQDELDDAEPGSIVSQTPDAGVTVDPGSTVVLRMAPALFEIPEVVGLDAGIAEQQLLDLGLEVVLEETRTRARSAGEVHRVDPRAGSQVDLGATVTLFIAEDPPPAEPSTRTVTVRLEVWRDWSAAEGAERCAGSSFLAAMRRGQTVALLGPDGSELSAVLLDDGFIEESVVDDERDTPPASGVCAWDLSFPDVAEVATYRLDLPHGEVSGSTSLSDARRAGWDLGIWWWS